MNEMNQGNGSAATGILVAAAAGAVLGAGVALLFAPCSGAETREWLGRRSRDLKESTTSAIEHGKQALRRTAKEVGRTANEVGRTATEIGRDVAEIGRDVADASSGLGPSGSMRG